MRRSLALSAALAATLSAQGANGQVAVQAVPVGTDLARVGPMPVEILANGTVAAESVVTVRPRVDGQIERVHIREGQMVRRGDPLFTLDSRIIRATLAQQQAQLERDRALAARAQADLARYQTLRGGGYAAAQKVEQAQADALASAATVRADEALIEQTKVNIEFSTIVAEIDGRLGALPIRVGNVVRQAESTALATVTQVDPILVQFSVPERWLPDIVGAPPEAPPKVQARTERDTGPGVEGRLVFVDSAVDTATGTVALKARFDNTTGALWPGQYVRVSLIPRTDAAALSVAVAAVQSGQTGRFVFVLASDGTARKYPVELVRIVGNRAVVRGEVSAGDRVIVDGAQRVTDGSPAIERLAAAPAAPGGHGR